MHTRERLGSVNTIRDAHIQPSIKRHTDTHTHPPTHTHTHLLTPTHSRCASPLSPFFSVTFNLICDKTTKLPPHKALVAVDDEPNSCRFNFIFRSPACCPIYHPIPSPSPNNNNNHNPLAPPQSTATTSVPAALLVLILVALALAGYCGAGSVYKARVRGCQGVETIPHVDQLRSVARGFVQHVYRPLRRGVLGLISSSSSMMGVAAGGASVEQGQGQGQGKGDGGVMSRGGGFSGGFSPHSAASRVALAGREALLAGLEGGEEEVAL
jgi:hypothetical protein